MKFCPCSDVLHPNRPNVSKDELRSKLSELYKASKDQVSCFGFRTQYGGGKSTGFALIYDSGEAMKKFEPHYRLVRYGQATKIEKASRQQREYTLARLVVARLSWADIAVPNEEVHESGNGMLTIIALQASRGRTARRSPEARPRPRPATRRRNRRVFPGAYDGWCIRLAALRCGSHACMIWCGKGASPAFVMLGV